ncbi:spore germination protein [Paenibacillus cremeus]|uniref:Spore germination protein n=1 Tax=Paenibacillus cremeus TaxID=2163881 RepID=A0A559K8I1_9BACL|nr:spore germination protein [Paenibacillus cremeus]TVY08434.1 spore germination protein [Paenibacillus cremeus]
MFGPGSKFMRWRQPKKPDPEIGLENKLERLEHIKISLRLQINTERLQQALGKSDDLVIRHFCIGGHTDYAAALIYIDGMTNTAVTDEFILKAAMLDIRSHDLEDSVSSEQMHRRLQQFGLPVNEVDQADNLKKVVRSVLSGDTAMLIDYNDKALLLNTKGWEKRGVEEPRTESVVRGPRNGFTETLRINTAQIRLRIKDPDLIVKNMTVGKRSNTDVAVIYLDGVANEQIVQTVVKRIQAIDIDAAMESGYIEQFIEDNHWTPFPLIQNTERPDKATANILEGKIAIICDGSPFCLIAPAVFSQFYHSPEDYYERFLIGTLIRLIRVVSMGMALMLPSLYIAFSSFHPEMIPSRLVIAMAAGRSTVPFPSIVEAFLMEVTMEILREASVRLPGPIGPTIGIVGALVVGQAAVQAGIVSPIMVIVVALTTIGSFAAPSYSAAIALRMLRFPLMIAAALFGLYGIMLFLILIIIHLCSLKSFGVPYMAPIAPSRVNDMKDTAIRVPLHWMKKRPSIFRPRDPVRYGETNTTEGKANESTPGSDTGADASGHGERRNE